MAICKALTEVLWHLDEKREDRGWDVQPDLWTLHQESLTAGADLIVAREFPGFEVAQALTGYSFGSLKSLIFVLGEISDDSRRKLIPNDHIVGVVLVEEAWSVMKPADEPDPVGSLADHPNRVEYRMCWLQTLTGERAVLIHERDGIARLEDDAELFSGRLADALAEITQLIA
jgi:hypothetical protein